MFTPAGTVHANFNVSHQPVKLLNILSPLVPGVSEERRMTETHGWEMIDVSNEQPWAGLRMTWGACHHCRSIDRRPDLGREFDTNSNP